MTNKVIMTGNLTRDPVRSETSAGITYTRFGIAVNRRFANAAGERDADFFDVITWRALAETCDKYLRKGSKACIVGSLQTGEYTDKQGVKHKTYTIAAEEVEFLTPQEKDAAPRQRIVDSEPIDDGEDLPF